TDAHLVIVAGFLRSYDAIPVTSGVHLDTTSDALLTGMTQFFLAALEIAGPMVVVLFLADVALGLLTRAPPQLNAFALRFPVTILLPLALVGFTFPVIPGAIQGLSDNAADAVLSMLGTPS